MVGEWLQLKWWNRIHFHDPINFMCQLLLGNIEKILKWMISSFLFLVLVRKEKKYWNMCCFVLNKQILWHFNKVNKKNVAKKKQHWSVVENIGKKFTGWTDLQRVPPTRFTILLNPEPRMIATKPWASCFFRTQNFDPADAAPLKTLTPCMHPTATPIFC